MRAGVKELPEPDRKATLSEYVSCYPFHDWFSYRYRVFKAAFEQHLRMFPPPEDFGQEVGLHTSYQRSIRAAVGVLDGM